MLTCFINSFYKKVQKKMLLLFLLFVNVINAALVDVTSTERYATVMNTGQYINPSGMPSTDPPQFLGIAYVAVQENGTMLQFTIVHQINFATMVTINGPAKTGQYSPTMVYILATGNAASGTNIPIQVTVPVTPTVLGFLRTGLLSAQVTSDGQTSGQISGNIIPSSQNMVNFLSLNTGSTYEVLYGMALLNFDTVRTQPANVGFLYWILSTVQGGVWSLMSLTDIQLSTIGTITSGGPNVTSVFTPYSHPPIRLTLPRSEVYNCIYVDGISNQSSANVKLALIQSLSVTSFQPFVLTTNAPLIT